MKRLPDSAWRTPLNKDTFIDILAYFRQVSGYQQAVSQRRMNKLINESHQINVGDTVIVNNSVGAWIFEVGLVTMLDEVVPVPGSIFHAVKKKGESEWKFYRPGEVLELRDKLFDLQNCKLIAQRYEDSNWTKRCSFTMTYLIELQQLRLAYERFNYGI